MTEHSYTPHEKCFVCMGGEDEIPRGCLEPIPGAVSWEGVDLHVMRARIREQWILEIDIAALARGEVVGSMRPFDGPGDVLAAANQTRLEWLLAVMYLLGWKRSEWMRYWEWI